MHDLLVSYRRVQENLRSVFKPAAAFEIWSSLLFVVSFTPATAWLMNQLVLRSGQYAISDNDLVTFFTSVDGILFLFLGIGFVLAFWFAEQTGLLIIVVRAAREGNVSVSRVLWEHLKYLPALIRLGLLQAAVYLAAGIPFGFAIGLTYWLLLKEYDLYFYLNVQPASWWIAVSIVGVLLAAYLLLTFWFYIRWLFSIPILVFENAGAMEALKRSWQQTRGKARRLGIPLAVCWFGIGILSTVTTWLIGAAAARLLAHPVSLWVMVPAVLGALAIIAVTDILWLIIGKTTHVLLMAQFYVEMAAIRPEPVEPAPVLVGHLPAGVRWAAWILALFVFLPAGVTAGIAFFGQVETGRPIEITGHRGSKVRAPENTLRALRQAIEEGADYAEIDVQTTADGVVVLLHDADLMRVASVRRRLRDIHSEDLRDIDVGSWFAPEFTGERIPSLQEVMDAARGKIKLNIELKYTWEDPELVRKVVDIIRRNGFVSHCVVSSLNYGALSEVERSFPELVTGFIVFQAIGDLSRMDADFLSISASRVTPGLVSDLHDRGKKVHVWTVNDPGNTLSMIMMGVDNIITDEPEKIRSWVEEWNELTYGERMALILRNLIVGLETPQPGEL